MFRGLLKSGYEVFIYACPNLEHRLKSGRHFLKNAAIHKMKMPKAKDNCSRHIRGIPKVQSRS